ncbi:uncharacterized protein LOC124840622, partial [Vigna umbellata]|uniref:uncharacterized protein LOC124840622 n=1 Tax=Vigna umbellata TaxID=87088 RepID=UPI001F5F28E3
MEDWEEERETVKADINQLKDQVGQILEALKAMKTTGEASSAKADDNAHTSIHDAVGAQFTFPMYGLPPGYTPPTGDHSEAEHTSLAFPVTSNVLPIGTQGPIHTTEAKLNETPKLPQTIAAQDAALQASVEGAKDKLEVLEGRLRAIEGFESYGFGDVARLSLAPGVTIPHKFKVPEFEKYKGNTCLKNHLTMYCRKMAAYAHDDKLLIHLFQDSLAEAALSWYTHLNSSHIRSWADLADSFVRQYKYNMHVAPDRLQLHHMTKKEEESFKEYAQRWRELAAQVEPPLYDKEMVAMFVSTLQPPFYEHMIGNVSSNFADIIIIGERIEIGLKNGKITAQPNTPKKSVFNPGKKKEGGVHATSSVPMWGGHTPTRSYTPSPSYPPYVNNTTPGSQIKSQPPGYYPPPQVSNNAWKVGVGMDPDRNVGQNTHPRREPGKNFTPIPMTYTKLLPHLLKKGMASIRPMKPLQPPYPHNYDPNASCNFHGGSVGHSTERCMALKFKVQSLIDAGWLKFQEDKPSVEINPLAEHGNTSTNAIEDGRHRLVRDVSEIRSSKKVIFETLMRLGLLRGGDDLGETCGICPGAEHIITECTRFRSFLQDLIDRSFLQIYYVNKEEEVFAQTGGEPNMTLSEPLVIRFTRTPPTLMTQGRMTKSGRISPSSLSAKEDVELSEEKSRPLDKNVKEISDEEACEFLKFIQQSEYKVVDQLKRMPAKISLLELHMHSTSHRKLLMKVLGGAHVEQNISLDQFKGIVNNITANDYLTFTDEEIPVEGRGHNKALHISVKCLDHAIARVLIDNGSSLNVMPKVTLEKLPYDVIHLKPSTMIVRAFDGSKRDVMGEIDLPVQVGPCVFQITFQVMDIHPAYSCLLGRPWIHSAGVVPSTLHQKLKYVMDNQLIIVSGEEDFLVKGPLSTRYIEAAEEALETAFQSLEIIGNTYIEPMPVNPYLSSASLMTAKVMLKEGFKHGKGLGKYGQGRTLLLELVENKNRYGLGYKPTREDKRRVRKEKEERSLARIEGRDPLIGRIRICDIRESFRSAGWINTSLIATIENEDEDSALVWPCTPETQLKNWRIENLPVMLVEICDNECFENDNIDTPNFEHPINKMEDDYEFEPEPSPELTRLVEQDSRELKPHQEEVEIFNVGENSERKEVKIGTGMQKEVKEELCALLKEFRDVFAWSYDDMPGLDTDIVQHRLPLKPECPPVKQKLRRMKPEISLKIKDEIQKQFDAGFLAVSRYPQWVANIVPVPKKDGKVRMCVDYHDLNRASPKDDFPLPHIDTLVDNTVKFSLFSFMDGVSGYNQIKMAPEDMEKTTFITLWGTFCYKVMPFGLKNAGATYQRAMVALFHDMMHKEIEVYVDDMIAKSKREEEHILNLKKLFERLRKFKLKLNPAKCTFGVKSGKLLGFVVSQKGIEVDPDKIRAIMEMPSPSTEKEVRGFLGRLNYIARFISQLAATCEPMFKLLRKNQPVKWNEDCQAAFDKVKRYLQDPPVLRPPESGRPLILYLTVLDESMGCVLGQHDISGKKEYAIYYLSKRFTDCERRYSQLERTCCALAWTAHCLRQYMLNHSTWLISKMDPIKYIFEKPALTGRIARWQMLLSEYDIVYVTQKSVKGRALADYLAQQPIRDYQPMQPNFPDEDILALFGKIEGGRSENSWTLLFDGASNVKGHGIGAVLISPENQYTPMTARLCFNCTNNIAEYEACVMGIKAAIEYKIKILNVYGDSALVINQLKGEWETRDGKLAPYQAYISKLNENFDSITFHHIPRDDNQLADALATLSSMFEINRDMEIPMIKMKSHAEPAYCHSIDAEPDGKPWYYNIKNYLKTQRYPEGTSENDKRTLRRLAGNFILNGDVLYKRNHDMVLLRCVEAKEAESILEEVHEGTFGTHMNGHSMARKILRAGYFWLTMERDCCAHVRKCEKCQKYANNINAPPVNLNVLTAPWPFSMWGIDVIGAIEPKATNGHRFILVAIDYSTKWVEAASYANVTRKVVTKFIKKDLICRYGLPDKIITDNARNLNNQMMKELCEEFKIRHHNSSPYRPQMNGAVEAANKNIKKIVQKMVVTYKDWHEMLPFALHGYRTSVRTSTGATPFSLVYGMEAVLPFEVEIPSLRVLMETRLEEAEWIQTRFDQLNLIKEKWLTSACQGQLYQQRMKKTFNKKVRPREFQEGEL